MNDNASSPEERATIGALTSEFEQQLARVGVDLRAASPLIREKAQPVKQPVFDREYEMTFTVDVSGILAALRQLPDSAGTSAFVATYNAGHEHIRC